ncbi:MAG TPA: hypothetical protein VGI26_00920 [Solirubrobacteraceae bacterium]
MVLLPAGRSSSSHAESDTIAAELGAVPSLSTAIVSATQGKYVADQMLLDITQGARVAYSAYSPTYPPSLSSLSLDPPMGAQVEEWPAVLERAKRAPQLLDPGLLASSIPGGAGYAPADGPEVSGATGISIHTFKRGSSLTRFDWTLAADRSGKIAAIAFGPPRTFLARVAKLRATRRLVVADLPVGAQGYADLRSLAATRAPNELLTVIQSAREVTGNELLWLSFAGLGPGERTLTSQTTNQNGLVASIDVAPTILRHFNLPIPLDMRGKPIRTDGTLHIASLRALKARLGVISSRRIAAIGWVVVAWLILLACASLPLGARAARKRRTAWGMRTGALAVLWIPAAQLIPAAIEPSRTAEFALLVTSCFVLALLTDRLLPWPRAPLATAIVAVVALSVDALAHTQLLIRSLLGPNPILGARFYGIGNELKSGLTVLVFTAVAAALYPAVRSRRTASVMAGAGIALAIVEGSARIGAGVGGVILVSAGTAVATVMLLPGKVNRKRILIAMAAPVVALVGLAALDLLTAHGSGHFTGSILDARSASDIRDVIERRYSAAWDELRNHLMPVATAVALALSALAVWRRERVCAPVDSDPAWMAALSGGLTAGVVGALSEDSGPVLLVVAVFMLGCVLAYLWGKPPAQQQPVASTTSGGAVPALAAQDDLVL